MTPTSTYIEYGFDLLTPDGCMIAEDIPWRGTISGKRQRAEPDVGIMGAFYEDVDFADIEIQVTTCDKHGSFFKGEFVWRDLPDELKPAFQRALETDGMQERIREWLEDARYEAA